MCRDDCICHGLKGRLTELLNVCLGQPSLRAGGNDHAVQPIARFVLGRMGDNEQVFSEAGILLPLGLVWVQRADTRGWM